MPYTDRFIATDNLIAQLRPVIGAINDAAILSSYAGFLSVSSVTVFELAIKDIFIEFASKKHKVFGVFAEKIFKQINGRIKLPDLRDKHIRTFGDNYLKKFDKILKAREQAVLTASHTSISTLYSNIILCRHEFVHQGNTTLTTNEVINSYELGKEVIHCLNDTMRR